MLPKSFINWSQLGRLTEAVIRDDRLTSRAKTLILAIAYRVGLKDGYISWGELETLTQASRAQLYWAPSLDAKHGGPSPLHQLELYGYGRWVHGKTSVSSPHYAIEWTSYAGHQTSDAGHQTSDAGHQTSDAWNPRGGAISASVCENSGPKERGKEIPKESLNKPLSKGKEAACGNIVDNSQLPAPTKPRGQVLTASLLRTWRSKWHHAGISSQRIEQTIAQAAGACKAGLSLQTLVGQCKHIEEAYPADSWPTFVEAYVQLSVKRLKRPARASPEPQFELFNQSQD